MEENLVCTECEFIGPPKMVKRGSAGMEWFLWLTLLIPGPFYSFWRIMNKKRICAKCNGTILVTLDSRLGRVIAGKQGFEPSDEDFLKKVQSTSMSKAEMEMARLRENAKKAKEKAANPELAKPEKPVNKNPQNPNEW